jgi:replicative DNA helicase
MPADVVDISAARRERAPLPHDVDAEASVLGGIILRNEVLEKLPSLEIDDFYLLQHRAVFEAMRNLRASERPIDVVTLEHEIESRGKLEAIGGVGFFGELALRVPTVDNVVTYAEIVQKHARNRRAIVGLSSALERARNWQHDPSEMISEVLGELRRLEDASKPPAKRLRLISIGQALEELDSIARAPVYPTPFETVNDAIGFGGFLGTQVYTVAAGTGRGKTTWVAEVGAFAAQTVPVIVASYEMKPGYFVARKAAGVLGVHSNAIIRGQVSYGAVLQAMPYPRMFLMHKPTLRELREAVQFVCDKFGQAPLVVVDYIQKLADEIALQQQRPDLRIATSQASATLLDIADRTQCAMLAVSAIGRGKAILKNPRKHEPYELVEVAKESGAVEYDGAGMIVLSLSNESDGEERIGTMTIAKARFGREIHIEARYHGARGTWRDLGEVWTTNEDKPSSSKPRASAAQPLEINEDSVRARIVAELQKQPARNKTALKERVTGCRRVIVGALISRMIDEGVIAQIGEGLTLSPTGRQLVMTPTEAQ